MHYYSIISFYLLQTYRENFKKITDKRNKELIKFEENNSNIEIKYTKKEIKEIIMAKTQDYIQ